MIPQGAAGAARRLLDRSRDLPFGLVRPLVLAAAAGALGRADPAAAREAAAARTDPRAALVALAALAAADPRADPPHDRPADRPHDQPHDRRHERPHERPHDRPHDRDVRAELVRVAAAIVPEERAEALAAAEPLLARIDAGWAWSWIAELIGRDAALRSGIGLCLAAYGARPGPYPSEVFERQRVADAAARAAVAGTRRAPASGPEGMFPQEAAAFLVAEAAADPAGCLRWADAALRVHRMAELLPALRLCARVAPAAEVADRARRPGFVAEQAGWTAAAAAGGALRGAALVDHVMKLAPRVAGELDPGREHVAGHPLLEALGREPSAAGALLDLAARWEVDAAELADLLFDAEAAPGAAALAKQPAERLPERPAGPPETLALAAHPPWRPLPGTLADITRWNRRAPGTG